MIRRGFVYLIIYLAAFFAAELGETAFALHEIEHSVIRLHIPADSDSTADQTAKLLVRDALLAHAGEWIPAGADFAESCSAVRAHLPEIRQTALSALQDAGCAASVRVSFGEMSFPERSYGSFTLPAGDYTALRVEIGSGEGQNWWCVMYPALCLPAASDCEPADILSAAACDLTEHPDEYELRLKCVDLFRTAVRRVTRKTETLRPA